MLFEVSDIENVVDRFLFSRLNKGAGVDYNYICLGLLGSDLVTCRREMVKHYLSVQLIFWTTERNKTNFH